METTMTSIAAALNAAADDDRWVVFEQLCLQNNLTPDYDYHEGEGAPCADELRAVEGRLVLHGGQWVVDPFSLA